MIVIILLVEIVVIKILVKCGFKPMIKFMVCCNYLLYSWMILVVVLGCSLVWNFDYGIKMIIKLQKRQYNNKQR